MKNWLINPGYASENFMFRYIWYYYYLTKQIDTGCVNIYSRRLDFDIVKDGSVWVQFDTIKIETVWCYFIWSFEYFWFGEIISHRYDYSNL